jgi:hypothetical protein
MNSLSTISVCLATATGLLVFANPASAQETACITSTAEAMLVPTSEIIVTETGPVDPESGVQTLLMRNQRTGMTAECRYNQIDQQVMAVEIMDVGINPPPSEPIAQETACITSTAEAMVVPTSEIVVTETGPVDAESGVVTLFMLNQRTGMTAECRYNQIDQQVMAVEIMDVGINPPPIEPITQETACITSTAEAMLVPTSEIVVTETGPVDPESGVVTLSMRNQRTGMMAECRYNQIDQQVMAVEIMDVGINPPPIGTPPTQGTFAGLGNVSGSIFDPAQRVDASLNFNPSGNFNFSLAVLPGTGDQVQYLGVITQNRSLGANDFRLQTRVQRFVSSENNLQMVDANGSCTIEVFDARVTSARCNASGQNGNTQFTGMSQF